VEETEVLLKERLESIAKWKTSKGFDILNKRQNWNALPKKPT
jgi:hypothetical protein